MKNNKFISYVLNSYPGFSCVDSYFYVKPVDHILSGFFCEVTPNGAYIYKFLYPLFDRFKIIHLGYSERLPYPEGYINFDSTPKEDLAQEFSKRIELYVQSAYESLSIYNFLYSIENQNIRLKNPRTKKNYCCALIMVGRFNEAKLYLKEVIDQLSDAPPAYGEDLDDSKKILNLLDSNAELARDLILGWEKEAKKRYGIEC